MRIAELTTTLLEAEHDAKDIFVKTLKGKGKYQITTTGSVFDAKVVVPYDSDEAKKILRTQLPKVETAAEVMGVTWKVLYATQFMQGADYMSTGKHSHPAWTYVLVGSDSKGNEVAYWKYEGQVAGGGQSNVFVNKDKNSKEKLSNIIDSKNKKWASKYVAASVEAGAKNAADKAALKGKKKLTVDELGTLLQKAPKVRNLVAKGNAKVMKPEGLNWRVVNRAPAKPKKKPAGRAYIFKPSSQGRVKLIHQGLYGITELKRGYADFGYSTEVGVFNTLTDAINRAALMWNSKYY
jgi:hypothetical protein